MERDRRRAKSFGVGAWICVLALSCSPAAEQRPEEVSEAARKAHAEGRTDEALELGLLALQELESLGEDSPGLVASLHDLASFHESRGELERAVSYRRRAVETRQAQSGPPDLSLAAAYGELAEQYQQLGNLREAAVCLSRVLEIRESLVGANDVDVARVSSDLALLLMASDPDEAQRLLEHAIGVLEGALPPGHPDLAVAMTNYGQLMIQGGDLASAEPWLRRAMEIYRLHAPGSARLAVGMDNLAEVLRLRGNIDEAEELLKGSIEILEGQLGAEHPQLATSLNNLALLYRQQSRYDDAEPIYRRAVTHLERTVGPEHPDLAATIFNLARLHDAREQPGAAEPLFLRSLDMYERTMGPDHPQTAIVLRGYARMLDKNGQSEKAATLEERARRILDGG